MEYAPIIIFAYNRLNHLQDCLSSLGNAENANESVLYIFSDGPKPGQEGKVAAVRDYLRSEALKNKFKSINLIESEENKGLASSVIAGVTLVIEQHKKCVIIEDDTVVTYDFIKYMNEGLEFYKNNMKIWSIAGMGLINPQLINEDVYFLGRICSCAWATWENRWDLVDWNVSDYSNFRFNFIRRMKFNELGTDRSNMLDRQMLGKINSWAIRFDYSSFNNHMVSVYPRYTKAKDNGHDGSGTHFTTATDRLEVELPIVIKPYKFTNNVKVTNKIVKEFRNSFKLRWQARLKRIVLREAEFLMRGKRP